MNAFRSHRIMVILEYAGPADILILLMRKVIIVNYLQRKLLTGTQCLLDRFTIEEKLTLGHTRIIRVQNGNYQIGGTTRQSNLLQRACCLRLGIQIPENSYAVLNPILKYLIHGSGFKKKMKRQKIWCQPQRQMMNRFHFSIKVLNKTGGNANVQCKNTAS